MEIHSPMLETFSLCPILMSGPRRLGDARAGGRGEMAGPGPQAPSSHHKQSRNREGKAGQRGTAGRSQHPAACKARSVLSGDEIVTYEWECVGTGSKTSRLRGSGWWALSEQ